MLYAEIIFLIVVLAFLTSGVIAIVGKILKLVYKKADAYLLAFASVLGSRVQNSFFATRRSINGHYQNRKISVKCDYLERFPEVDISTMVQAVPPKKRSLLPFSKQPTENTFLTGKKVYCRIPLQGIIRLTSLDPGMYEVEIKKILDELLEAVTVVELGEEFYK
ncbi:MAG: hypothetical protein JW869_04685 [Candidatus Omnitrophica bacterium]|nr:hypothetical protein [Candidatus Omnitrophota bacterium]